MRHWILKGKRRSEFGYENDFARMLQARKIGTWHSAKLLGVIEPDDRLFVYEGSPKFEIWGLATYVRRVGEARFEVRYDTGAFKDRVQRDRDGFGSDPTFEGATFLKPGAVQTIYEITESQAEWLYRAVVARTPTAARVWPEHGGRPASPNAPTKAGAPVPPGPELQFSTTPPDELLQAFHQQTAGLPRSTEAERLVIQRIGQGMFRQRLIGHWKGRCAITGLAVVDLLRASHIKPWADCDTDAERLDEFNGLLLAPHLDAAFDRGFISVGDDGKVMLSSQLRSKDRAVLGLSEGLGARALTARHRKYLDWHRSRVFRTR